MWDFINSLFDKLFVSNNEVNVESQISRIKKNSVPKHVAIIMDGNGRWAKRKGMPRSAGHQAGVNSLQRIVRVAQEIGINYITAYAFSTENWKRPDKEVNFLMDLFEEVFEKELDNFNQGDIKVNIIGYKNRLPKSVRQKVTKIMEITANNKGLTLNIALDYGGRAEITTAAKRLVNDVINQKLNLDNITEEEVSNRLYTAGQPEVDLLIRPGGEYRISNFLLWQIAYAELYFSDIYWPNFTRENFLEIIEKFQNSERRFGGLKESR